MECNVIKDLLVLYADNLCSEESKKIVEEHLSRCESCKKFYDDLSGNLHEVTLDDAAIEENLREKDLLSRSKNRIKLVTIQKMLKVINIAFIVLNLLFVMGGVLFMVKAYSARYPAVNMEAEYLIAYAAVLLPLAAGVIEICTLKKIKHHIARTVSNLLLQFLFTAVSLVTASCLFIILPPLSSATDAPADYLAVDSGVEEYEDVYGAFFPEKIPVNADGIDYRYLKEEGLFSRKVVITGSWELPENEYLEEKNRILRDCHTEKNEDGGYDIIIEGLRYPGKAEMSLECDDKTGRLTYRFTLDNNY